MHAWSFPPFFAASDCIASALISATRSNPQCNCVWCALRPLQIWTVDLDNPKDCMSKFVSNTQVGGLLAAGVIAGKLLAV
jgi:hypothetical protein